MYREELSIYISGLIVDEPVTVLTDLIITGICLYALIRLWRAYDALQPVSMLICFFPLLGLGTLLGGILGHGLRHMLAPAWLLPGWMISMAAVAVMGHASIRTLARFAGAGLIRGLEWLNGVFLLVAVLVVANSRDFILVVAYTNIEIVFLVGGIQLAVYRISVRKMDTGSAAGASWFFGAIGAGLASDLAYILNPVTFEWFNRNDLCHILLAFSVWMFYRGSESFLEVEKRADPSHSS